MIYIVNNINDPYSNFLKDDPVRPNIKIEERFGINKNILALVENSEIRAVVCTKTCSEVPRNESELLQDYSISPNIIVFYTIWSYYKGAGQQLIIEALKELKVKHPNVKRYVTLSPMTDQARNFHLRNGAQIFRVNTDSVNYEYI